MSRKVLGVGINDADYVIRSTIDGKRVLCPFYMTWRNMLERCYSPAYQATKPTYIGCSMVAEWHSFTEFRSWMLDQDWKGKQLDKDLLIEDNKIYSPVACVFVDAKTNLLLNDRAASRGDLPIGVAMRGNGYQAQCRKNGKLISLGTYTTPEEAHAAYKIFKAEVIHEAALQQSDERVKTALIGRAAEFEAFY